MPIMEMAATDTVVGAAIVIAAEVPTNHNQIIPMRPRRARP